jgi:putative phage-type endonuclease
MKEYTHPRHGTIAVTNHVYDLVQKDKREWCPQRSAEWFEKRKNHITASVMASICKANPYETRLSVLKRKIGTEEGFEGNAATEWGNKYEDEAILKYEQLQNERVLQFGLLESLNPGEEFLAGSPDGITASGKLIEVKCPFRRRPTHDVPVYYVYQVQFLMHILRLPVCDFIQYVPGNEWLQDVLIVTRIKYDEAFFRLKFRFLRSFWDSVLEIRSLHAGEDDEALGSLDEHELAVIDFIDDESGERTAVRHQESQKIVTLPRKQQKKKERSDDTANTTTDDSSGRGGVKRSRSNKKVQGCIISHDEV